MSLLFGDKKRPQYAKGGVDLTFLLFVLVLLVFGLVMMFSASYAYAYYYDGNSFHYITRQLIFAIMGLAPGLLCFLGLSYLASVRLAVFGGTGGAADFGVYPSPLSTMPTGGSGSAARASSPQRSRNFLWYWCLLT